MTLADFLAMHGMGVSIALVIAAAGVAFYLAFKE